MVDVEHLLEGAARRHEPGRREVLAAAQAMDRGVASPYGRWLRPPMDPRTAEHEVGQRMRHSAFGQQRDAIVAADVNLSPSGAETLTRKRVTEKRPRASEERGVRPCCNEICIDLSSRRAFLRRCWESVHRRHWVADDVSSPQQFLHRHQGAAHEKVGIEVDAAMVRQRASLPASENATRVGICQNALGRSGTCDAMLERLTNRISK